MTRRLGYGFERKRSDFTRLGVDSLFMDTERTSPQAKEALLKGATRGDTIVVLRVSDLGAGRGLANLRDHLTERGVGLEVAGDPEPVDPAKIGRPRAWSPTPEQDACLRVAWHDPKMDGAHLIRRVCDMMALDGDSSKHRAKARARMMTLYGARRKAE